VLATHSAYWQADGGPYLYPYSGYAGAITRGADDWLGGLSELGGMGSGDHHMAPGLIGHADATMPGGTAEAYRREMMRWQDRALRHINGNVGYVPGAVEHLFHGRKGERGYQSRREMFVHHASTPHEDLKRHSFGVLEFATNKPELRHGFDL
jgi:hypothetical protein